jgi:hypothetical protein
MARFNITSFKQEIIADILSCPEVIRLLGVRDPDFDPEEPDSLVYENIFPYLRIPDTTMEAKTYILLQTDLTRVSDTNAAYNEIRITLWAMAHESQMRLTDRSGTRIDRLGEALIELFDGRTKYGFSKGLDLQMNREVILGGHPEFQYREIVFTTNDIRPAVMRRFRGAI